VASHRKVNSIKGELLIKSREAALGAVQTFNNPLIEFKSETFIVLMNIAWTYLMHAYYRSIDVEYRYFEQGPQRRRFHRTKSGAFKYWELERCLDAKKSPIDRDTANNLKFLIGLRHEIEHQMTSRLDSYLSGRYQACCLNYNFYIKELFGDNCGLDQQLSYSLQFAELSYEQSVALRAKLSVPENLKTYVENFDETLTEEEFNSERYSFRLIFTKKLAGHRGQADKVVEFLDPNSDLAKAIDSELWVIRETERPKLLPSEIVKEMRTLGFTKFGMHQHIELWKSANAKSPEKGYGVSVGKTWYWYERWRDRVRKHCEEKGSEYR
jgi:hypothetical protein